MPAPTKKYIFMTNTIGKLNRRITIEQNTAAIDAGGGWSNSASSWVAITPTAIWAYVLAYRGNEVYKSDQVEAQKTYWVVIRYQSSVSKIVGVANIIEKFRVRYGTRILNIRDVENLEERNIELHMLCEEIQGLTANQ